MCLDQYRQRYGRTRGHPPLRPDSQMARRSRRRLVDLADAVVDPACVADPALTDPDDQVEAEDRRVALRRAIETLSPGDQLLLRVRYEDELSAREIAALLGLPTPFHVYRRLSAICATLRLRLESAAAARPA
jgi:RNA polymerase sigma factor (sigma-70 family)